MPSCRVCGKSAWIRIPWANAWFCREHFVEYFERKVWRTFEEYVPKNHKRVLLAVSGGKDSISMLYSLAPRLVAGGYSVSVLHVDLGISGHSDSAREVVSKSASELGLDLVTYDLESEHGFTIDRVAEAVKIRLLRKPVCSLCGIVKRHVLNEVALERGFDLVMTGHTLDDMYGFIVSDIVSGNLVELAKLKPYARGESGFVARAKPLFFNYEHENRQYIVAKEINIVGAACPYKPSEGKAVVRSLKKQLEELERGHPGIGIMFLKNFVNRVAPILERGMVNSEAELVNCSVCGYPSSTSPCSFCRLKQKLEGARS